MVGFIYTSLLVRNELDKPSVSYQPILTWRNTRLEISISMIIQPEATTMMMMMMIMIMMRVKSPLGACNMLGVAYFCGEGTGIRVVGSMLCHVCFPHDDDSDVM